MSSYFGEFFGTMIMIILGNGVVRMQPKIKTMRRGEYPVVQNADIAVQFLRNLKIVRDNDDRRMEQRPHVVDEGNERAAVIDVQVRDRFVEQ